MTDAYYRSAVPEVSLREDAACDADRPSDIPDRGWSASAFLAD